MSEENARSEFTPPEENGSGTPAPAPAPAPEANGGVQPEGTPPAEPAKPEAEALPPAPAELEQLRKGLLQSYNRKMQLLNTERKGIEETRKKAELFDKLTADEGFQRWYRSGQQSASQEPGNPAITQEKLEAAASDPKALAALVQQMVQEGVKQAIAPVKQTVEERETQAMLAQEYADARAIGGDEFIVAHKSGLLESYYQEGLNMKQAYATYLLDKKNGSAPAPAPSAATQPPGRSAGSGEAVRTVKVKDMAEALDAAYAARQKGQKINIVMEK